MSLRKDYLVSFATEGAVLIAGLLVLRLAAIRWGVDDFSAYVLARRTIALLYVPLLLGLASALPRRLAEEGGAKLLPRGAFLAAALGIGLAGIGAIVLASLFGANRMAAVLLGSQKHVALVSPITWAVSGFILHSIGYANLRGQFRFAGANILQAVNLALVPVMMLMLVRGTVERVLTVQGLAWLLVSSFGIWSAHAWTRDVSARTVVLAARSLLTFGVPRVPADFLAGAFLSLPATIAARSQGLVAAGNVSVGLSLLSMVGSVFAPLGVVLLPAVSRHGGGGGGRALRRHVWKLLTASTVVTAIGTVAVVPFVGWILTTYLGAAMEGAVTTARLLLVAGTPWVAYVVLRSPLDGLDERPLNAYNLAVSLGVFLGVAHWLPSMYAAEIGVVAGLFLLAMLTVRSFVRVAPAEFRKS